MATQFQDDEWEYSSEPPKAPSSVPSVSDDEWEYSTQSQPTEIKKTSWPEFKYTPPKKSKYGNIRGDEEVVFKDEVRKPLEVGRFTPEQEDEIAAFINYNRGNPDFDLNSYSDYITNKMGLKGHTFDDSPEFFKAVRESGKYSTEQTYKDLLPSQEKFEESAKETAEAEPSTIQAVGDYLLESMGFNPNRMKDITNEGVLYGFSGIMGNLLNDWKDTGSEEIRKMYPTLTDDQVEQLSDEAIRRSEVALRSYYAKKFKQDPAWRPDEGFLSNIASGRWIPGAVGGLATSVGPESLIMPGGSALTRSLLQVPISGLAETGYEAADVSRGVSDEMSPENILLAAGLGGLFQGGIEVPGIIRRAKGVKGAVDDVIEPIAEPSRTIPTEGEPGLPGPLGVEGETGIPGPRFTPKAEPKVETPKVSIDEVKSKVYDISHDWKNAPEVEVVNSVDDIADPSVRDSIDDPDNTLGFLGEDGKVRIIAGNIKNAAEIPSILYHESLAHHGLAQRFNEDLDDLLGRMYNSGGKFKDEVDDWITNNPDYLEAYKDDVNPKARFVEEVLAGRSESGIVPPPNILAKMKLYLKDFARKMGMKNLAFSDEEIQTIIGMAHDATINGRPTAVDNGFRYAKTYHGSPHDFDAFDHSKMGTGEGAQVFGWGTYLSDSKGIAKSYRDKLSDAKPTWDGEEVSYWNLRRDANEYAQDKYGYRGEELVTQYMAYLNANAGNKPKNGKELFNWYMNEPAWEQSLNSWDNMRADWRDKYNLIFDDLDKKIGMNNQGKLYEVEVPDDATWIDWDFQPNEEVKKAFNELSEELNIPEITSVYANSAQMEVLSRKLRDANQKLHGIQDEMDEITAKQLDDDDGDFYTPEMAAKYRELRLEENALGREISYLRDHIDNLNPPGEVLYKRLADRVGPEQASKQLAAKGITGNKYAANSRSGDPDFSKFNYVIFDDKTPKITNKYMKRRVGPESEGMLQGSSTREGPRSRDEQATPIAKFRSNRDLTAINEEVMPERDRQSWDEWIDDAGNIKMTAKAAENLAIGTTPPELLAAQQFFLRSQNRIFDLSRKGANQTLSPREIESLRVEMEKAKRIAQSISDVVANAARLMNSRNIEISDDRALAGNIRRMLRSVDTNKLNDPVELQKIAAELMKGNDKAQAMGTALNVAAEALNLPRSLMSSMDLSAPLRQGIFLVGRKKFWGAIPTMFKQAFSEDAYQLALNDIKARPTFPTMRAAGLALTDNGRNLFKREEAFLSTWAEKIPVVGRGVRGSERAYVGFLNKLRADIFDDILRKYNQAGINMGVDKDGKFIGDRKALKDIARFVNNATGRGDLGNFSQAAQELGNAFFSPRLMVSRVNMLNPVFYTKLDPIVRREALKSLASFGGIASIVLTLAGLAGANVELDPRSSDFLKIKTGNTRYDILGGFGQYLVLGARLITNERKNAKGEVEELGKKYGSDTRLDVLGKFFTNKEAPLASYLTDYLRGKNAVGEDFDATQGAVKRFIPMFFQDAAELVKDRGAVGIPMALPGLFGVGTQTYHVNLGYDAFGRSIEELQKSKELDTDPVATEIAKLNTDSGETPLSAAPFSLKSNGVSYKLTDEQHDEWQQVMGDLQHQFLSEDIQSPEWTEGTVEDRVNIAEKAHRDAFAQTKDYMLTKILGETADDEFEYSKK